MPCILQTSAAGWKAQVLRGHLRSATVVRPSLGIREECAREAGKRRGI